MCDPDSLDEVHISVPRDGYPSLVFVEFAPRGEWKATVLTHHSGDALDHLDRRARAVLRAYASGLLRSRSTRSRSPVDLPAVD